MFLSETSPWRRASSTLEKVQTSWPHFILARHASDQKTYCCFFAVAALHPIAWGRYWRAQPFLLCLFWWWIRHRCFHCFLHPTYAYKLRISKNYASAVGKPLQVLQWRAEAVIMAAASVELNMSLPWEHLWSLQNPSWLSMFKSGLAIVVSGSPPDT